MTPSHNHAQNKPVTSANDDPSGDPKSFLLWLMLKEIKSANGSIVSVPDTLRKVYEDNQIVRGYIGDKLTHNENRRVRKLFRDIIRHKNIDPVKYKPQLLVRWKKSEQADSDSDGGTSQ